MLTITLEALYHCAQYKGTALERSSSSIVTRSICRFLFNQTMLNNVIKRNRINKSIMSTNVGLLLQYLN
jgi:hypothetical protein